MSQPNWTRKPSKLSVATNEGWEQTYLGKTKVIKAHKGLLNALLEAGYNQYGELVQVAYVAPVVAQEPVEVVLTVSTPEQLVEVFGDTGEQLVLTDLTFAPAVEVVRVHESTDKEAEIARLREPMPDIGELPEFWTTPPAVVVEDVVLDTPEAKTEAVSQLVETVKRGRGRPRKSHFVS